MDSKTYAKIDAATAAFDLARLHELEALRRALRAAGISMTLIGDFIEEKTVRGRQAEIEARQWQAAFERNAKRCPACGNLMLLAGVNTGPRDQVGGPWRSQWYCPDINCAETVYNAESPAEILKAMGLIMPPVRPVAAGAPQRRKCNGKA